jgi:WD40 repeat protein
MNSTDNNFQVSDFTQITDKRLGSHFGGFRYLFYIPDSNEVIATSTRRNIAFWRFNSVAPCTVLSGNSDIIDCLCYTSHEPVLIFSGGDEGVIKKWERMQLNTFMYR